MNESKSLSNVAFLFLSLTLVAGCVKSDSPRPVDSASTSARSPTSSAGAMYLWDKEPAAAKSVQVLRVEAKDGEEVTMVGRIGGAVQPWVDGMTVFHIVDLSLTPCTEEQKEACTTPWDYCCHADVLPANTAIVKVVNAAEQVIAIDARELLGLKELQTVVVRGKASRDADGSLIVLAAGVYVRK